MRILKIHSVFLIVMLILLYGNGIDARFSFKAAMQKVGSFAKAAAATGLALATKNLPIPLSMIPGGAQLQKALGPGISVGGVDLAAAAADPKAAMKQIAMKKAAEATGMDVQGLGQMAQGGDLKQLAGAKSMMRPRMGAAMRGNAPIAPPNAGQPPFQQQPIRRMFRPPSMLRALPLPPYQPMQQPPPNVQQQEQMPQYAAAQPPPMQPQYAAPPPQQPMQPNYAFQQQQQPMQANAPPQPLPFTPPNQYAPQAPPRYFNQGMFPQQQQAAYAPQQMQQPMAYANQPQPMAYANQPQPMMYAQ